MSSVATPLQTPASEAIPKSRFDARPLALMAVLALAAWPLVGSSSTWLTLTTAGLAMGMIIFITASGLTLVFGLMDVLNFGHSLFIALGAFIATSIFGWLTGWQATSPAAPPAPRLVGLQEQRNVFRHPVSAPSDPRQMSIIGSVGRRCLY